MDVFLKFRKVAGRKRRDANVKTRHGIVYFVVQADPDSTPTSVPAENLANKLDWISCASELRYR